MARIGGIAGRPIVQIALGAVLLIAGTLLGAFVPLDNALRDWRFSFAPQQASGNQRFYGADLSHHIRFGPLHFNNIAAYTNTEEADKVRVPEWLLESSLYLEGFLFKKALFSQLGVQATYASSYYADAYMPVTQQFYVQDNFVVQGYPVVDVFLNADIKSVILFLKMSHVNDGLLEPAYFLTPYYPGMRRSFVFGLKWMFFD